MDNIFIVDKPTLKAATDTDELSLLVTIGLYAFFIPVVSYYTWKYSKVRNEPCIKSRRPMITIYVEIIILCMFVNRIIGCVNGIYPELYILRIIYILLYGIGNHSILWLCTIKYWLLFYDVQFVLFCEDNQWKTHINKNNVTYHTNWFVVNRATFGNESYLLRKVLIIILFPAIIVPLSTFIRYTTKYDAMIDLFFMIIPICLTSIFWLKTPKYLDYFRVREECRMLLIIGVVLVTFYLILSMIAAFFLNPHDFFFAAFGIELIYLFGLCTAALHLTCWTILKNKHRINVSRRKSSIYLYYRSLHRAMTPKKGKLPSGKPRISMHSRSQISGVAAIGPTDEQNESIVLLTCILEHAHGLIMFVSHLMSEFCLESVLAIIEFTQYQMLMQDIYSKKEVDVKINELYILRLPDINVVPQSMIVYDSESDSGTHDVKKIASRLVTKYIVSGSEFEINISYKLKKKLLDDLALIDELDEMKLVHLFDESIQSLLLLLNDCLARFVDTPKYKQIEKELEKLTLEMEANAGLDKMGNNHLKIQHKSYDTVETVTENTNAPIITPLTSKNDSEHEESEVADLDVGSLPKSGNDDNDNDNVEDIAYDV